MKFTKRDIEKAEALLVKLSPRWTLSNLLPAVLPPSWTRTDRVPQVNGYEAATFQSVWDLTVIVTVDDFSRPDLVEHRGVGVWLHASVAHPRRYPGWDALREVKELFIGRDREAVQIFPVAAEYVNVHPNCFHLWSRLDAPTLPDGPTP